MVTGATQGRAEALEEDMGHKGHSARRGERAQRERQEAAVERQALRDGRTDAAQLERLPQSGAVKERARLAKRMKKESEG